MIQSALTHAHTNMWGNLTQMSVCSIHSLVSIEISRLCIGFLDLTKTRNGFNVKDKITNKLI